MRTQVVVVGAGPAGTLLGLMLQQRGVGCVVLERQSKDYVLGRIRAGVLEWGSVQILRDLGLSERMDRDGIAHGEVQMGWRGEDILTIDMHKLVGKQMMVYGQTMVQEDLYAAAETRSLPIVFDADNVELHNVTGDAPYVTFSHNATTERIDCDLIAGCDGYHGVSRRTVPAEAKTEYEKAYPFGWLGILSETPPLPELMYVNSDQGFALCSQRHEMLSRYYVQCPLEDSVDDWSDDRFWSTLLERVPRSAAEAIVTGPSIEKSIAPLRSYVVEPLQYGNLYLAGDAAHIVPPTGAKGLNLAISDVYYLAQAIAGWADGDPAGLAGYSDQALRRVWNSVRFSWWMTMLLHRFPDQAPFDQKVQEKDLEYLSQSEPAQRSLAEQYVGLPL